MLRQARNSLADFTSPRRAPPAMAGSHATAGLLDDIDPTSQARVLVIGEDTLEVLCALIRRGCAEATELCRDDRAETHSADLVLVPHVTNLDSMRRAVSQARRALVPGGRIRLRVAADPSGQVGLGAARVLREASFSAIRSRVVPNGTLLSAERPGSGPFVRA
ncbi:MAG: hypothetical protein JOZ17_16485 [Acetobacteraceae bacterium]|nr:hypothetical protein [Acetobacteraceae bacterium]MBV8614392.1 hypothetical protein [Acetobacteraceae bacterium]